MSTLNKLSFSNSVLIARPNYIEIGKLHSVGVLLNDLSITALMFVIKCQQITYET